MHYVYKYPLQNDKVIMFQLTKILIKLFLRKRKRYTAHYF